MTIAYIDQMFPSLTKTFVYRQVQTLRARGMNIHSFSNRMPKVAALSDDAKHEVLSTFYLLPVDFSRLFLGHAIYIFRHPKRYFETLFLCLLGKHRAKRGRLRTLIHFCESVPLAREIERRNAHHIHATFANNAATLALAASRLADTTFSFTAHAYDIFVDQLLLPEKIKAAAFVTVISEYNKRFLHNILRSQKTLPKIHLVRCGIDINHFSVLQQRLPRKTFNILSVGRLVEKKGFPYLINACKILSDQGVDFQCQIIGGGPQQRTLEQIIRRQGLSHYVKIIGIVFQQNLRDYLVQSDVFVLPCCVARDMDMDGIPNTLMEAMAMEIPTISTNISGIPELIEHMKTGLLVPPEDEGALAIALRTLVENEQLRKKLGEAGRRKVVEEFEIGKSTDHLFRIFESYVAKA